MDDFPPLRGGERKRRPAVYLDLDDVPPGGGATVVLVGISTEPPDPKLDWDAIRIERVLPQPCWVYPGWVVEVPRAAVKEEAGKLPLVSLEPLTIAVIDRSWEVDTREGDSGGVGS